MREGSKMMEVQAINRGSLRILSAEVAGHGAKTLTKFPQTPERLHQSQEARMKFTLGHYYL